MSQAQRLVLVLILVAYLALGALFAVQTPAWQAPDEPAHYNYVRYLAENGAFPVLHMGDYPHAYLEEIKAAGFPPDLPITPIRYESHQPPLYYALAAPVYSLTGGSLLALRLFSVALGAGIVLLAFGIARRALPGRPAAALGAAAFVAFLPQHLATASQVGNDVLAELLLAAVLFYLTGRVTAGSVSSAAGLLRRPIFLGILLGLILITKTTAYIALPLAAGALAWCWAQERAPLRRIVAEGLAALAPAALVALPWYARNLYVYGWPDFLGLIRHDQIVIGQTRTAQFIAENGPATYWRRAIEWTFKSFVGVFGWMGVWLDTRVYYFLGLWLGVPLAASAAALGLRGRRGARHARQPRTAGRAAAPDTPTRPNAAAVLLAASALLTLLTYIYYNLTFLQHQGRYLFTALIPIAVFLAAWWERALTPTVARALVVIALAWAAVMAAWGLGIGALPATGAPKWPLALTFALAVGLATASALPLRWRRWAYVLPFALLPGVALYALFAAIAP